jgi:hypothetical protein
VREEACPVDRVVIGHKEDSMIGFRWSGNEPEGLNDRKLAEEFGCIWEGDELVCYDMESLRWQIDRMDDNFLEDND